MPFFKLLFIVANACLGAFFLPSSDVTTSESTTSPSFLPVSARADASCFNIWRGPSAAVWPSYFWCSDGSGAVFTNGPGGRYSVQWSESNAWFIGGKGWFPGTTTRVINYSGSYQVSASNSDLAVYGWARNPLIEYYIVESYGAYNPSSAASRKGTVFCDGANYDILQTTRVNQPSIDGTQTFQQFWSVRNPKKNPNGAVNGTITVGCHFNAWKQYGMNLGSSHQYQIFVVEGSGGSGSATITIS